MTEFALFDTALGACAIAWGEAGIVGSALPEASAAATRARMARRHSEAPPDDEARAAIAAITALIAGETRDLRDIRLDEARLGDFERRLYAAARAIGPGRTTTYGELAAQLGEPGAARAVGQAMGRNPFPIIVPCHRVLAAGGKTGGFSARGGVATKLKLLEIEGALLADLPLFNHDASTKA